MYLRRSQLIVVFFEAHDWTWRRLSHTQKNGQDISQILYYITTVWLTYSDAHGHLTTTGIDSDKRATQVHC